jgi:hypothetical protein
MGNFLREPSAGHLRFERRLPKRRNRRTILVPLQKPFDRDDFCLTLLHDHGLVPLLRVGDVLGLVTSQHHPHTMATPYSVEFAELSAHYRHSLAAMFDPHDNVDYAARFLEELRARDADGRWRPPAIMRARQ